LMISISIYYMASYVPILLRSWLVMVMVDQFGDTFWVNNLALFIGIVFGVIWNFTIYSRFIWKRDKAAK